MRLVTALALALALALAACGEHPASAPISNQSAGPPAPRIGLPAIDVAAFTRLVDGGSWAGMIDPTRGVVEVHKVSSARDNVPDDFWVRRKCGADAPAAAAAMADQLGRRLRDHPTDYPVNCGAIGDVVACEQQGLMEYDLNYGFEFEHHGDGYVLIGIGVSDVGTVGEAAEAVEKNTEVEMAKPTGC